MEVAQKNRIFYYDILRAFAIFCIVSCHVFAIYVTNVDIFATKFWYGSLFLNSLRDLGILLFVILSGCLLLNKKENLTTFIKKRFSRVIIPYLFWATVFILCAIIFKHYGYNFTNFSNLGDLIFGTISVLPQSRAVYLWFVPMILIVYAIIFVINKINEHYEHTLKISLLLSILGLALLNFNLISLSNIYIKYCFFSVFAVIGYYLANFDFTCGKLSSKHLYIIFGIIFIISYVLEISITASTSLNLNQYTPVSQLSWINLIATASLFLFVRYFAQSYEINDYNSNSVSKIIFSISICSYGIYLCHMIVKYVFTDIVLCHVKNYIPISLFSILTLILTFFCSFILILLLNKIPHLKKVSGAG